MSIPSPVAVADLYPHLSRILLFAAFEEAGGDAEPNYQQIVLTPADEAVFSLDCSREECVGGGFHFGRAIDEMVSSEESRNHLNLTCQGTLGDTGHVCSLKAEVRIIVS